MTDGYKIKRVLIWQGGQEKQIYPAVKWNGDLTKASLNTNYSISGYLIYGIAFNDDGTKFYYQTNNGNRTASTLHQFDLSTAYNVSTKSNEKTFNFGSSSSSYGVYPNNILFKNSGKYLYLSYSNSGPCYIEWYELSTAYDISTATLKNQLYTGFNDTVGGHYISDDGMKFWIFCSNGIYYKNLSTQWQPEVGTIINSNNYRGYNFVSPDGKYLYADTGTTIIQYSLQNVFDFTSITQVASLNKQSGSYGHGIDFDKDGDILFTTRGGVNSQLVYRYNIS